MTVLRGFAITIASGIGFGCLGAIVGRTLGLLAPDYYQVVLHIPPDLPLDPTQVGLGLGLTQGTATGVLIGLVIVVAVAWYRSRLAAR